MTDPKTLLTVYCILILRLCFSAGVNSGLGQSQVLAEGGRRKDDFT